MPITQIKFSTDLKLHSLVTPQITCFNYERLTHYMYVQTKKLLSCHKKLEFIMFNIFIYLEKCYPNYIAAQKVESTEHLSISCQLYLDPFKGKIQPNNIIFCTQSETNYNLPLNILTRFKSII